MDSHGGVDISIRGGAYGKNIVAVLDGTVVIATYHYSYGNYLAIDHGNGLVTIAHCGKLLVGKGDRVKQGQVIALIGSTGNSTDPTCTLRSTTAVRPDERLDLTAHALRKEI